MYVGSLAVFLVIITYLVDETCKSDFPIIDQNSTLLSIFNIFFIFVFNLALMDLRLSDLENT